MCSILCGHCFFFFNEFLLWMFDTGTQISSVAEPIFFRFGSGSTFVQISAPAPAPYIIYYMSQWRFFFFLVCSKLTEKNIYHQNNYGSRSQIISAPRAPQLCYSVGTRYCRTGPFSVGSRLWL